jgi:hypothetical protein
MATGQIPFLNKTHQEIYDLVVNKNWRMPFTPNVPEAMKKLITSCLSRRPTDRPDFKDIVQQFKSGNLLFTGCTGVTPELLDPEEPCPLLDLAYLVDTLKNPSCPQFPSVVNFLANHIDEKVRSKLRDARILASLPPDSANLDSVLILAGELLEPVGFKSFFEAKGRRIFEILLNGGSSTSAIAVVRFCLKAPKNSLSVILPFLPSIVKWIDAKDAGPYIIRFLCVLPSDEIIKYSAEVLSFFTGHGLDDITQASEIEAVAKLLPLFVEAMAPADLQRFVRVLERGFDVPLALINLLIQRTPGDALSRLAFAVIRASARTDVSGPLSEILLKCSQSDLEDLALRPDVFDAIQQLFDHNRMIDTALLLLFYLASVPSVPIGIAKHPVLQSLLQIDGRQPQRLQILTALVASEEFCANTTIIEGIEKLLIASISVENLSEYCLLLIGALSSHTRGCSLIQETGMLSLFSHMFLSSTVGDTTTAYTILRNAARGRAEIPQVSLIVSCMMQDLLYSGGNKAEILITLRELVQFSPESVQEHDLQNSVVPLISARAEGRDAATVIVLALNLIAACDLGKIRGFYEKLAQKIFDVLNSDAFLYPELIATAANLIALMSSEYDMQVYLDRTDFVNFIRYVWQTVPSSFADTKLLLNSAIAALSERSSSLLVGDPGSSPLV